MMSICLTGFIVSVKRVNALNIVFEATSVRAPGGSQISTPFKPEDRWPPSRINSRNSQGGIKTPKKAKIIKEKKRKYNDSTIKDDNDVRQKVR